MATKKDTSTIDQLLEKIGEFGRFQKMLDVMLFALNMPVAYQILITYFTTFTPSWECRGNSSKCVYNGTMAGSDTRRCQLPRSEWYYTKPKEYSLVTDLNIDCKKEWMLPMLSSVYFIGWAVGGLVLGYVGDIYGRKFIIFPSILTTIILGFLTSFLNNVYLIMFCRFVIGFFNPGSTLQSFILVSEYVGSRYRSLAGIIIYATFPTGYILVALQAYITQNWRTLYLICTVPYILTMAFYRFIPESVKWLLLHGNSDTIERTLQRVAYWNKTELPDANIKVKVYTPKEEEEANTNSQSLSQIFRTRRYVLLTLAQSCVWLATGIAYFGLSLIADDLGGTLYRDFIILSAIELPAYPVTIYLSNRFGRKPATIVPLFLGGVCSIIVVLIPMGGHIKILRIIVGILGKFCLSITFNAVYTWTLEIYPTSVRSTGMGFLQTVSHLGSCGAPWIAKGLRHFAKWLPYVAMGIPAIVAAVIGLSLPETKEENTRKKTAPKNYTEDMVQSYVNDGVQSC